ncbi:hypothetical protein Sjap_005666 [Stephania japonica]|uniref:DUF4283 domain-containing protein n=1 Tax=Stephania japonica TaxID=461633 RepID=A0AAP0PI79_9MAGN
MDNSVATRTTISEGKNNIGGDGDRDATNSLGGKEAGVRRGAGLIERTETWSPKKHYSNRRWGGEYCWIIVEGLPLKLWSDDTFRLIGAKFGGLEAVHLSTRERTTLDGARLKISRIVKATQGLFASPLQIRAITGGKGIEEEMSSVDKGREATTPLLDKDCIAAEHRLKKGKLHQSKNIDTRGFGAWGYFAFGEVTKDIITTNLEKLLLCFQSGLDKTNHNGHNRTSGSRTRGGWRNKEKLNGQYQPGEQSTEGQGDLMGTEDRCRNLMQWLLSCYWTWVRMGVVCDGPNFPRRLGTPGLVQASESSLGGPNKPSQPPFIRLNSL